MKHIIALVFLLGFAAQGCHSQKDADPRYWAEVSVSKVLAQTGPTDASPYLKLDLKLNSAGEFSGTVKNISPKTLEFVLLRPEFYGPDGETLGSTLENYAFMPPGRVWKIQKSAPGAKSFKLRTVLVQE